MHAVTDMQRVDTDPATPTTADVAAAAPAASPLASALTGDVAPPAEPMEPMEPALLNQDVVQVGDDASNGDASFVDCQTMAKFVLTMMGTTKRLMDKYGNKDVDVDGVKATLAIAAAATAMALDAVREPRQSVEINTRRTAVAKTIADLSHHAETMRTSSGKILPTMDTADELARIAGNLAQLTERMARAEAAPERARKRRAGYKNVIRDLAGGQPDDIQRATVAVLAHLRTHPSKYGAKKRKRDDEDGDGNGNDGDGGEDGDEDGNKRAGKRPCAQQQQQS